MYARLVQLLLLALVAAGCAGDGSTLGPDGKPGAEEVESPTKDITLTQISEQIFAVSCAVSGCHSGGAPAANMSLEADFVAGEIIDIDSSERPELKRIDPGNPDSSYLLMKLRADDGILCCQMPPVGTLTDEQIEMIREWIADGAPLE